MVQIKAIRRRRNFYALFFTLSTLLTGWFGITAKTEVAFAFGTVIVIFLILLILKNRLLYDATLIWDNRILAVSSALISKTGGTGQNHTEETVVSTFGILIGTKIYRWGLNGVHGVRLVGIEIDRQRMILTFGDANQSTRIELLHGMTDQKEILGVKRKFWYETGVTADITGW
ncbi:MAG: hypothetical protein PHH84_00675 [Oscillospiraceae bacterium]|nr:hypothetical protein [Oscillospiraceae bacterium]MDD4413297.1 hypothetical protein [Oscillospiraceae bacterium]